ncbi:hypothetical protein KHS38_20180 [Mucilaginibacter sp. Bleaf8]|uniref:hypothetical protein n=1 Tax=Mucilaginibacter sp. Bleaf8 TaxID=2834430 RepID=UPI001BCD34DD|nr:hypothetical protein [Mucilaginibacter sp. Bleaf8]MBS7566734.1 hypothetical protein [Mucilaginibacter sp. Bleaf8]
MNAQYIYMICAALLLQPVYGCNNKRGAQNTTSNKPETTSVQTQTQVKPALSDEQQFRQFLKAFKLAVKQKNKAQLLQMFNDPVQTGPQWSNEDLQSSSVDHREDLVSRQELPQYFDDIFTKDAQRLIPGSVEDELSEIDKHTTENYYQLLSQTADKGSTLYELQIQFVQDNGKETSFGFVFGKIKGTYRILSYYSPWPLKG